MEETLPRFADLLSEKDLDLYRSLRSNLSSPSCRNCRNKRLENFNEMLNSIKEFSIRNDGDDWKRCLVCGVCWISDGIAINTHQLTVLLGKCKSSINGSLHRMKYVPFPSSNQASKELMELIPLLKNSFAELRQWTLRKQVVYTPQPQLKDESESKVETKNIGAITPKPKLDFDIDFFNSFDDSQQQQSIQKHDSNVSEDKGNFFEEDPFSIPLEQWNEHCFDEENSPCYEE